MKKYNYFLIVVVVFVVAGLFLARYFLNQNVYAEDNSGNYYGSTGTKESKAPEISETPKPSETPEASETPKGSQTPGVESQKQQQEKAQEEISNATEKLNELSSLTSKWGSINPLPQNISTLYDLAKTKLANAQDAFKNSDFGEAAGQAQSAASTAESAIESLGKETEATNVEQQISNKIENKSIMKIEVNAESADKGQLQLQNTNGSLSSQSVPFSKTPVVNLETTDAGIVGVSVASKSKVLLENNGITVESNLPIIIDTVNKTISVKTAAGVVLIKKLPSQAFGSLSPSDKPTTFSSISLENNNNQLEYHASGVQNIKLLGIVPVQTSIETVVNASSGNVVSYKNLGFCQYSVSCSQNSSPKVYKLVTGTIKWLRRNREKRPSVKPLFILDVCAQGSNYASLSSLQGPLKGETLCA